MRIRYSVNTAAVISHCDRFVGTATATENPFICVNEATMTQRFLQCNRNKLKRDPLLTEDFEGYHTCMPNHKYVQLIV